MSSVYQWPGMLLIGGAGKNSGKTRLSCALIRRFGQRHPVVGIKVTAVKERDEPCPRGEDGCGVCTSIDAAYHLTEEGSGPEGKDTALMYAAGARPVYWLRVLHEDLALGAEALIKKIGRDTLCVCESNSLRRVVEPGVFIIARARGASSMKRSSREVLHLADRVALSDDEGLDITPDDFDIIDGRWTVKGKETQ